MKDANIQALRKKELDDVKDDKEREEYHKRLAAKVHELRNSEGDFLEALQRAVENISDGDMQSLHDWYNRDAREVIGLCISSMIDYQFDAMAKEEIGSYD